MHRIVFFTFLIILGLIVGGCGSSRGTNVAKTGPAVLDVTPAPIPAAEPAMASMPISDSPVAFSAPAPAAPAAAAPAPAAKTYTVKKGDTLFSIAKNQLGSGRDWQKIAAANPGLTPTKLRAGQQIAMP